MVLPDHRCKQHQQVVIAGPDDDLLWSAVDSACLMEIAADGAAQPVFPLWTSQPKQLRLVIQQAFPGKLPPGIIGKAVQIHSVWRKVIGKGVFFLSVSVWMHRHGTFQLI